MGRHRCLLRNCAGKSKSGDVMHRIPNVISRGTPHRINLSVARRQAWIKWLQSNEEDLTESLINHGRICGRHFLSGKAADLQDFTNPDWVPSILDPLLQQDAEEVSLQIDMLPTEEGSEQPPTTESSLLPPEEGSEQPPTTESSLLPPEEGSGQPPTTTSSTQTSLTSQDIDKMTEDILSLEEEKQCLEAQLKKLQFDSASFKNDPTRLKYFTGLESYDVLMSIFQLVKPYIKCRLKRITKFLRFILTLIRLRLNLDFHLFAYQFDVSCATASNIFYKCIDVLYRRFKNFVLWPDREVLQSKIPEPFEHAFGKKVAVIIDCFEIMIEAPANLLAKAQCWSYYKHNYTVKYLLGITPQGAISFICEGWGGRTSDKHLTQNCGILDNLIPGDFVLADRGFTVQDSVRFFGAELKIPAFTKGKKQLHPFDIELTRKLASVRIYVERVIGVLRQKFGILSGKLPISLLVRNGAKAAKIDKILTVCSALVNLCPSVISMG